MLLGCASAPPKSKNNKKQPRKRFKGTERVHVGDSERNEGPVWKFDRVLWPGRQLQWRRQRWHGCGSHLVFHQQQFSMQTASYDLHVLSTCFGCVSVSAGDLHFACWFFIFQGVVLWTVALLALIGQVSAHQRVMYVRERKCAYVCAQARTHTLLRMCTRARAKLHILY